MIEPGGWTDRWNNASQDAKRWAIGAVVIAVVTVLILTSDGSGGGDGGGGASGVEVIEYHALSPSRLHVTLRTESGGSCYVAAYIGGSVVGSDRFGLETGKLQGATITIENEEAGYVDSVRPDC